MSKLRFLQAHALSDHESNGVVPARVSYTQCYVGLYTDVPATRFLDLAILASNQFLPLCSPRVMPPMCAPFRLHEDGPWPPYSEGFMVAGVAGLVKSLAEILSE